MKAGGTTTRQKLREWIRRYLPCEIAGTVGELGGAAIAYLATGSLAAAAITATIGASAGYYATAYVSALRWSYRQLQGRNWAARVVMANLLALRSVAIEFGPAELIDSIAIRPVAYYLGPLMFSNVIVGWIFGKLVSDLAFYICAIFSYERFKGLLARRQPRAEEVSDEPARRSQLRDCLRADAARFTALAERHGTPLLVLQPHLVARRYRRLSERLPGFRLHYAVKAQPHPVVLTTIAICGGGFDVATSAEVDLLQQLGLPMERCIHTNPIKKPKDIDHAYAAGIRTFVVENPCEAAKFMSRPADIELLVRLAFRNPTAKSDLSSKFGADAADAELLVKHVIASSVQFAGFTFHVGSQTSSAQPYRAALRGTLDLVAHIQATLGVRTRVIDIGGGFPVSYRDPMPTIDAIADIVDDVLGATRDEFTLLAEPGRFLAADCMTLLTSVVGTGVRDGQVWHYLDDGLYGSYSNVMTEDVHPPILALRELFNDPDETCEFERVTLAGPTCDSADVIARDYPMPALDVGDVVISPMMGAYTTVTSSRFNGIAATPIVMS